MPEDKIAPSTNSYSAAINACEEGGQWQPALQLLSLMPKEKVVPNTMAYSAAISACEKCGRWQSALPRLSWMPARRLCEMQSLTVQPSVPSRWSMAVSSTSCELDVSSKVVPNTIAHGAAITACGEGGQQQSALHILSSMLKTRLCHAQSLAVQPSAPVTKVNGNQLYNF